MGVFLSTLNQTGFLFTLIVIGFILAKFKFIPDNSNTVLAKLENTVFVPALVMGTFIKYFTVEKLGEEGKAEVKNPVFIPTVFDYTRSFYNNHIYLLENYTAEQAKAHGMAYYGNSTTLEALIGYVKNNINAEFLPEFLQDNENE